MGSQVTNDQGFPSLRSKGDDYFYNPGCGGKGAGGCPVPISWTYMYWTVKVPQFAVRNRHLVLLNDSFMAYNDAGPDGFGCNDSQGTTSYGYTVYLLYALPSSPSSATFAANAVSKKVISAPATTPFQLNFDAPNLIPQQANPSWVGTITVVLDFGISGLITGVPQNYEAMKTIALDYDERQ